MTNRVVCPSRLSDTGVSPGLAVVFCSNQPSIDALDFHHTDHPQPLNLHSKSRMTFMYIEKFKRNSVCSYSYCGLNQALSYVCLTIEGVNCIQINNN